MHLASLLCALSLAAAPASQDAPRLRTVLPSGSVVFVENVPNARQLSVQLIASTKGVRDTPAAYGWRHLLEHLLLKGPQKDLEAKLESQGMFLTGETGRDAMTLAIIAPPDKLEAALGGIRQLLQPLQTTPEEIAKEARIIEQELGLAPASKRLSRRLWFSAFGEHGLDPLGEPEAIAKAAPSAMELLRRRHFAAQNLVLAIAGPVSLDEATRLARAVLPLEKDPFEPDAFRRPPGQAVRTTEGGGDGVAVPVPGWDAPQTAAVLAAALALASEKGGCSVLFTPSHQPGLVILASEDIGLGAWLDGLKQGQIDGLFGRGKSLADRWLRRQLDGPAAIASLRGFLYSQSITATPEAMQEIIKAMSLAGFREAVEAFRKGGAE